MVKDDKYSDKEFDSEQEMHLYWAENHMEELNSHDKQKAKKALREKENKKAEKMEWRKKMLLRGVAGLVLVGLVAVSAGPIMSMISGGATIDYDKLNLSEQPMLGSEDASVTVVEFGDYLCPHCRTFDQDVKPELQNLIDSGDVNFYYLDRNVITPLGGKSGTASVSAQCVYQQSEEEFWSYHSALFDRQNQIGYDTESLVTLAEQNTEGLNYTKLKACISNRETLESIQNDNRVGVEVGATSTPSVYVNGQKISNWDSLVSYIEDNHL